MRQAFAHNADFVMAQTGGNRAPGPAITVATILQHHTHVTLLIGNAASRLQLADYFRSTYTAKPAWPGL